MSKRSGDDGLVLSFIGGLIAGALVSAPVAAWLSPRRGADTREEIRQRGVIIRRKATQTVTEPVRQAQEQIAHLQDTVSETVGKVQGQIGSQIDTLQERVKGESIEDSIEEGKAIAAQKQAQAIHDAQHALDTPRE